MTQATWTEEEIARLPQTQQVFDRPQMRFDQHTWQQEGYYLTDICNPHTADCHNVGIPIPTGKLLIKKNGRYDLVDETDVAARS